MIEIVRIDETFEQWDELLSLIHEAFAYMEGVIDPPSSAQRLDAEALKQRARDETAFIAVEGGRLLGCVFCRPEPQSLYLGKFAVSADAQGRGIGRQLLNAAEALAKEQGLSALRLETRIELTGNHVRFGNWGFRRTGERSHPGYTRTTTIEMTKTL